MRRRHHDLLSNLFGSARRSRPGPFHRSLLGSLALALGVAASGVAFAQPSDRETDPDVNSLLLVPTSETLPKGDIYYRNFLILFNNVGFAITDDLALSFGSLFPVTSELTMFSVGAKLRVLSRETHPVGLAGAASFTWIDDETLGTSTGIASLGNARRSLSMAGSVIVTDADPVGLLMVGGDIQVGRRVKLLAEWMNTTEEALADDDDDFRGVLNVGFRLFWDDVSFTLTGLRPLFTDGDFLAFPLAAFSAHF